MHGRWSFLVNLLLCVVSGRKPTYPVQEGDEVKLFLKYSFNGMEYQHLDEQLNDTTHIRLNFKLQNFHADRIILPSKKRISKEGNTTFLPYIARGVELEYDLRVQVNDQLYVFSAHNSLKVWIKHIHLNVNFVANSSTVESRFEKVRYTVVPSDRTEEGVAQWIEDWISSNQLRQLLQQRISSSYQNMLNFEEERPEPEEWEIPCNSPFCLIWIVPMLCLNDIFACF